MKKRVDLRLPVEIYRQIRKRKRENRRSSLSAEVVAMLERAIAREEIENRLNTVYGLIDNDHLMKARMLARIIEKAYGMCPEVRAVKSLLDRLEILTG